MRINPFDYSQNIDSTEQVTRKQDKKTAPTSSSQQDGVQISPQLQERLAQAPDVRQDRVDAVKQARDSGSYNVSDGQLADAMFKEFFGR